MEKLDIQNMLKDKSRAKANSEQGWYKFRTKLIHKCKLNGIEVRLADTYFPSSKLCSKCGYKDKDLKLSARTYICPNCGFVLDRDLNASINLRDLKDYIIA